MVAIEEVEWNKIKLTVVMPLYNRRDYMEQAINSVLLQQTEFRVLLVIADDASTDGSAELAAEVERRYPRDILTVYSDNNQGLLANDLRVFKDMHSDYFCVLDPDDYWVDGQFLQKAVRFLEEHLEYVAYGSNTKRLIDGELEDGFYIRTGVKEHTTNGIENYLDGSALVTHTTASVYRNSMFKNGVPAIMENAVGTMSEASFRGDVDRYVMHLKYGKAKFVNDWVGVYRIHEKGICQGSTMFHWMLMNVRAELDYSRFYEDVYLEKFKEKAKINFKRVCVEIYKAAVYETFFGMDEYDKENFAFLMNELSEGRNDIAGRNVEFSFKDEETKVRNFIRNKEKRRLIIWGTGGSMEVLTKKYEISFDNIFCFVDGSGAAVGTRLHGRNVISVYDLKDIENKYVILMSSYDKEILACIKKEKICPLADVINLYYYDRYVANL